MKAMHNIEVRIWWRRIVDLAMRVVPVTGLIAIAAYVAANQTISPHRRVIKLAVLLALMSFMIRFDMVFSVYLFTLLYPFPSGVALGSTNSILMTVIPLVWAVRAASTKSRLWRKTAVDVPIVLLLAAHIVSFFNIDSNFALIQSLKIMWRAVAAIAFFYLIVTFVNDEKKLTTITKVLCVSCGLVMLTAVLELFFPGATIIPGWVGLPQVLGEGKLAHRIEGVRVGGSFSSHSMLSDFGTQVFFLMCYHVYRSRNPLEKTIWGAVGILTIVAILATANRGAFFGFVVGIVYLLFLFRKQISVTRMVLIATTMIALFLVSQMLLDKYTHAASITSRITGTQFQGIVPDTRMNTWKPALIKSLEHPFIGHGPYFATMSRGLEPMLWPHNGFIFYLYTTGMFGLGAFLFVLYRIARYSRVFKTPGWEETPIGEIGKILHATLVVMLFEQLRTDHQRDDIYPYMVWGLFGMIVATSMIIQSRSGGASEPAK